ncbi:hypothetical protein CBF37_10020 [Vagococcus vulneris]|uniref:Probable membrane transporter protein n=1 Tax=Vagococcus vulneris TaxID=1977869 RepID=A0A429ZUD1_9ENTE|nr:sulfite exporter TauE/SafE family protein [Vagococcus vulneris]RST97337.1 hypothetical protein CBF37_10020 [Vagococcus vulneris]
MEVGLIYFLVIIIANTIGAISGMGGGVIIKPILDSLHIHSVAAITFYSSIAVLMMSVISTIKQIRQGKQINWPFVIQISLGSVTGGIIGNYAFEFFLNRFPDERVVLIIQITLTVLTLLFALLYNKFQWTALHLKSTSSKVLTGFTLGFLASFLGIGGGPINVALLMLCFSIPIKMATVYSIITIFFSQLSKLAIILITIDLARYDLNMLYFVVPAGALGGIIGASISQKITSQTVNHIYRWVVVVVILLNVYNAIKLLN